jgi:polysaccharide biosynthesis transport protein
MDQPLLPAPGRDVVVGAATFGGYPSCPESSGYGFADDPGSGGPLKYFRTLYRRKGTLMMFGFFGLLTAMLLTLPQTPVYQARASLEIQDLNDNFLNMKQITPVSDGNSYTALTDIQTQIKLLQSESLVKRVLARLKSHAPGSSTESRSSVVPQVRTTPIDVWRRALHLPDPKLPDEFDPGLAARNLNVRAAGQTRIIELRYDSSTPRFAADFANALAQEFIDSNMEARWKMSQHTGEWLSHQLEDMRIKLERSEDSLQSYARRTGLMFTSESSNSEKTNIAEDKLRQLQEECSKAQGDRITKQARWEMTKTGSADGLPDVLNDSSLRSLQDKVTELRRQRAELITTYTEKHNKVQRVEAQIAPLEAALQKERSAIVGRLRNDYEAALRREALLEADYASQSRIVSDQAEKSIQYNILKRELDSNRQLYEAMLQRVKESSIASAMRASNVRIVDLAEPPVFPYKPSLRMNCILGLLSGLLLGVAFVTIRDNADSSLQNPGDAAFWLSVPELGMIPSAKKELGPRLNLYLSNKRSSLGKPRVLFPTDAPANAPTSDSYTPADSATVANDTGKQAAACMELISWQRKPGPVAESFRSLLTSILFSGENGTRPRVLVVSSANPMEGKTTVASNLGIAFAAIHHKVLIIDGDLRKPRMHEIFGVGNEHGLTTLLKHWPVEPDVLKTVLRQTSIPGLFVLPSGFAGQNPANLLYGAKLAELLATLKTEFDMVIIDTPPMLQMPDARVFGRLADAVILVTRAGQTTRDAAMAAKQRFAEDRTRVLGTILNDWNVKSSRSGYLVNRYGAYFG